MEIKRIPPRFTQPTAYIRYNKQTLILLYEMKNQQMLLFQFYSYIDGSLHVSDLQAHPQENSHSCSHIHWFSGCTVRAAARTVQPLNQWLCKQVCEFS
jgi:hypothetical protein